MVRRWRAVVGIVLLVLVTAGCGHAQPASGAAPMPTAPTVRPVVTPPLAPTPVPSTPTPSAVTTSSTGQAASVAYLPPSAALTAGAIFALTPHPTPTASPVPTATVVGAQVSFATVQQLLTGYCSGCHPPNQGMNLTAGQVYANIVNVRSQEDSALLRVHPGDPSASYLYLKVSESRPPIGGQMPLNGGPLTNDQLTTLRVWILQGAKGQ